MKRFYLFILLITNLYFGVSEEFETVEELYHFSEIYMYQTSLDRLLNDSIPFDQKEHFFLNSIESFIEDGILNSIDREGNNTLIVDSESNVEFSVILYTAKALKVAYENELDIIEVELKKKLDDSYYYRKRLLIIILNLEINNETFIINSLSKETNLKLISPLMNSLISNFSLYSDFLQISEKVLLNNPYFKINDYLNSYWLDLISEIHNNKPDLINNNVIEYLKYLSSPRSEEINKTIKEKAWDLLLKIDLWESVLSFVEYKS